MAEEFKDTLGEGHQENGDGCFFFDESSFTIKLEKGNRTVKWEEITSIIAYKIDQITIDCIVIEIHLTETFIMISEEIPEYNEFMRQASEILPDFKKDWWQAVVFPAFAANLTTLYTKKS